MVVLRRIPVQPIRHPAPVAAIGIFDGVHRGHQAILRKAVSRAKRFRGTPMAITFDPHPLAVLNPRLVPPMLLSLEARLEAFAREGVRVTLVIPFTRAFSRRSPERFVRELLVRRLQLREVVVGHDFGFGQGRSGSVATLKLLGRRFGFKVHAVGPVKLSGARISSRRIRELIQRGDLTKAEEFLGRPVTVVGRVIRGTGRGRNLGFPTANLQIEAGVLPPVGVYAVIGRVAGLPYPGMANLGFRPTFRVPGLRRERVPGLRPGTLSNPLLEVHLFGIRRPLYGRQLTVAFLKRLRPERRFPSPEALARQLSLDAARARSLGQKLALYRAGGGW